jgi:broad specificity phosphatase PhoE
MPMRMVVLIRHGATALNKGKKGDRIRGWLNVALSDVGIEESKKTGAKLAKDPNKPDLLVSSDLTRSWQTANIVSKLAKIQLAPPTMALRPWDLGEFAGQESEKVVPQIIKYVTEKPDKAVPGGESFNKFRNRALGGIAQILAAVPDELIGLVTHHRVERLIEAWRVAGFPPDGHIDLATFTKHGENTGAIQEIQFPVSGK